MASVCTTPKQAAATIWSFCSMASGVLVFLEKQLTALGEHFHVVAPDMRGYNLSDKPARVEDYKIDKVVKDVIGLIDHFGAKQAAIVGHDWGAGVAWAVAQKHPERVSRLAVIADPTRGSSRANM